MFQVQTASSWVEKLDTNSTQLRKLNLRKLSRSLLKLTMGRYSFLLWYARPQQLTSYLFVGKLVMAAGTLSLANFCHRLGDLSQVVIARLGPCDLTVLHLVVASCFSFYFLYPINVSCSCSPFLFHFFSSLGLLRFYWQPALSQTTFVWLNTFTCYGPHCGVSPWILVSKHLFLIDIFWSASSIF